jgi:hypothetical protein
LSAPLLCDCCGIDAYGVVRVPLTDLPDLRKNPGEFGGESASSHLKTADEQSILAVVAVLRAIHAFGWKDRSFTDWGVIAAPRFLGRIKVTTAFEKFQRVGVRGISPLIIPNLSLHAMAGTVSMAIGCHGPNFGVGGGPGHLSEVLQIGIGLVKQMDVPGLWVVVTEWSPEPIPDPTGQPLNQPIGYAIALALQADDSQAILRIERTSHLSPNSTEHPTVHQLADYLLEEGLDSSWHCRLEGGGLMSISRTAVTRIPLTGKRAG